eukprot:scaffold175657_cov33-Prasinocladus_malaysianus.AAC.1
MVQAAFGRNALAGTSFLCYIGLGLGLLGGNLSLAFGLYVLLVQRSAEQFIQVFLRPASLALFDLSEWYLMPAMSVCCGAAGFGYARVGRKAEPGLRPRALSLLDHAAKHPRPRHPR